VKNGPLKKGHTILKNSKSIYRNDSTSFGA
jgi:hypothetical protein